MVFTLVGGVNAKGLFIIGTFPDELKRYIEAGLKQEEILLNEV
jgi:hypothetical protein